MRKSKKKLAIILISLAVITCVLTIAIAGALVRGTVMTFKTYKDEMLLFMPTSYICKQIETEVPIGTDADTVIEFLKNKDGWWTDKSSADNNFKLYEGATGRYAVDYQSFYSFNNLNYDQDQGYYFTDAYIGSVPNQNTSLWIGNHVYVIFIFDENMRLMDIAVFRVLIGF